MGAIQGFSVRWPILGWLSFSLPLKGKSIRDFFLLEQVCNVDPQIICCLSCGIETVSQRLQRRKRRRKRRREIGRERERERGTEEEEEEEEKEREKVKEKQ